MTDAQLAAARANAAKSTGPITPAGKSKAALNARKHGLSAAHVVLPDESQADYKFLLEGYIEQFQPQSTVEFELVTTMAVARWRLRRLVNIETGVLYHYVLTRQKEMDLYRASMTPDDRLAWSFRQDRKSVV